MAHDRRSLFRHPAMKESLVLHISDARPLRMVRQFFPMGRLQVVLTSRGW
jgi:hypothetical protein